MMRDQHERKQARPDSRKVVVTAVALALVAIGFYVAAIVVQVVSR